MILVQIEPAFLRRCYFVETLQQLRIILDDIWNTEYAKMQTKFDAYKAELDENRKSGILSPSNCPKSEGTASTLPSMWQKLVLVR